jgi:hypothetical protein
MLNPNGASNAMAYFGAEAADLAQMQNCAGGIPVMLMSADPMERRF